MISLTDWIGIGALGIAITGSLIAYVKSFRTYADAVYARKADLARLEERLSAIDYRTKELVDATSEILTELRRPSPRE